jgi:hypothetical protein
VSFAEVLVVATATAVSIILATLILSQLVRAVIGNAENAKRFLAPAVGRTPHVAEPSPEELPATTTAASYVPAERSSGVKHLRRAKAEPRSARAGKEVEVPMGEPMGNHEGGSYARVGEEVAAVLSAAEHAAEQIRATAAEEAEETRRASEANAAATLADAQKARAEADAYANDTRAAADNYAEGARRRAENDAARKLAEAEQQAQRVVMDAKKKAGELLTEATRRRDVLSASTEDIEGRIESMLRSFRGVTTELEAMLSSRPPTAATEGDRQSDEALDDALKRTAAGDRRRTYVEP